MRGRRKRRAIYKKRIYESDEAISSFKKSIDEAVSKTRLLHREPFKTHNSRGQEKREKMQENNQIQCRFCSEYIDKNAGLCPVCRQSVAPDAVADLRRLPDCPICKIPIYPAKINIYSIYHCEECEGTAISKEVMMKLQPMDPKKLIRSQLAKEHVRPPYFEPRDKPPFLICPYCRKKMLEKKFTNMTVDICEKCGAVWFDEGKEKHINAILGSYKMKRLKENEWRRRG